MLVVIHDGRYLAIAAYMLLRWISLHLRQYRSQTWYSTRETSLVTPCIFGISPGSKIAYDTPLYVVPTSKATTSPRKRPW